VHKATFIVRGGRNENSEETKIINPFQDVVNSMMFENPDKGIHQNPLDVTG